LAGVVLDSLGAVKSAELPVVKVEVSGEVRTFPLRSCTPVMFIVYSAPAAKGEIGVRVMV
jgi:hypothetical protein